MNSTTFYPCLTRLILTPDVSAATIALAIFVSYPVIHCVICHVLYSPSVIFGEKGLDTTERPQ